MERRRINLDDSPQPQLALFEAKPAPGTERRIAGDAPFSRDYGKQEQQRPDAYHFPGRDAPIAYTEWSTGQPPSDGYWELRQKSARAPDAHNWWYSSRLNAWHRGVPQRVDKLAQFVPHMQLMQSHCWRGLAEQHPSGYPYDLAQAPFGTPLLQGSGVTGVEAADKIDVVATGVSQVDLNPARRRVQL